MIDAEAKSSKDTTDGPEPGSAPLLMKLVRRLASDAALGLAADQTWRGHTSVT